MLSSIYQKVLSAELSRLHPQIQKPFGFSSDDGVAAIGRGVMDRVWRGKSTRSPFSMSAPGRRIMFPEYGQSVPFTIENYAYRDTLGRKTVTWLRTFQTRKVRRFDAYMIHSRPRGTIMDVVAPPAPGRRH